MIFEQLKEYCNCIDCEVKDSDIDELINLISSYTCWAQKPCETFLSGERSESVELPSCMKDCDIFTFEPFYTPFDPESFTFTLIERDGIEENTTVLSDYKYSMTDEVFRLKLPLPDCKCKCTPKCECPKTYKLFVTYTAGYDEIPECLKPLFCEALQWIAEKNRCDCSECVPCDQNDYGTNTRIDKTTLTGTLKLFFLEMLTKQYIRQLGLISLCGQRQTCDMWSVVV